MIEQQNIDSLSEKIEQSYMDLYEVENEILYLTERMKKLKSVKDTIKQRISQYKKIEHEKNREEKTNKRIDKILEFYGNVDIDMKDKTYTDHISDYEIQSMVKNGFINGVKL